jgi:DNA-binding NtrC family response regulator
MDYANIVSTGGPITAAHLPQTVRFRRVSPAAAPATMPMNGNPSILQMPASAPAGSTRTLADIEMEHILRVLEKNNHNKPLTAKELGISLKTLYNKLNKWEEERRHAAG